MSRQEWTLKAPQGYSQISVQQSCTSDACACSTWAPPSWRLISTEQLCCLVFVSLTGEMVSGVLPRAFLKRIRNYKCDQVVFVLTSCWSQHTSKKIYTKYVVFFFPLSHGYFLNFCRCKESVRRNHTMLWFDRMLPTTLNCPGLRLPLHVPGFPVSLWKE